MDAETDARADSYGVALPSSWFEIPIERVAFDAFVSEVIGGLRQLDGVAASDIRRVELLFHQLHNDLARAEVRSVAAVVDVEDETDGDGLQLALAAVTISHLDKASLGTPLPLTSDVLIAALGRERLDDGKPLYVNIDPPAQVELDAGTAARVRRHHRASPSAGQVIEYYSDAFLVPHDDGESVCALQFTTPDVESGSLYSKLFEAIARTLKIYHPGDPTTMPGADG